MAIRELIEPKPGDKRYVRRDKAGHFTKEQDDVGRSLAQDRRKPAKRAAPRGQGDRGDRKSGQKKASRVLGDSKKSDGELIEEYSRIVTLMVTQRPEYALRVREIIGELRKRVATRHPSPRRRALRLAPLERPPRSGRARLG
jgi:hypothetical protein